MAIELYTGTQEALRARWQEAKSSYPALALAAHQALRALQAEERAQRALKRIIPSQQEDAYTYCEVLGLLGRALEAWAYIGARLWLLREAEQINEAIAALHESSLAQYAHILLWHQFVQEQAFSFCQEHQVLLRFAVITQTLDLAAPSHRGPTVVSLHEHHEKQNMHD